MYNGVKTIQKIVAKQFINVLIVGDLLKKRKKQMTKLNRRIKHVYVKNEWDNVWRCPEKDNIWYREKAEKVKAPFQRDKKRDVLGSMCKLGDYVLCLSLFCTHACSDEEFDRYLRWNKKVPIVYGYGFTLYTSRGEIVYFCELENNSYFDTRDINKAEQAAEFIWSCIEF
jgi:hypothetical protein